MCVCFGFNISWDFSIRKRYNTVVLHLNVLVVVPSVLNPSSYGGKV